MLASYATTSSGICSLQLGQKVDDNVTQYALVGGALTVVVGDAEQLKLLGMPALIRQSVQRDDRPVDDMEATEVALTQEEEQVGQ